MNAEFAPPTPAPAALDPFMMVGSKPPLGTTDPAIRELAVNPENVPENERQDVLGRAMKMAKSGPNIIVEDDNGVPRWGKEYPNAFTFDGQIRGQSAYVSKNGLTDAQYIQSMFSDGALRGEQSHVVFEMDDGQSILIRRTNEKTSAALQTFDLLSTSQEKGRAGQPIGRREIDTSMLKDVVVVPGEPLVLGRDPSSGKNIRTRGNVLSITAFGMTEDRVVDPKHPHLQNPEKQRDTIQSFGEKLRAIRRGEDAPALGATALHEDVAEPEVAVEQTDTDVDARTELLEQEMDNRTDNEIKEFLDDHGIDLHAANEKFEKAAQDYVRGLHATARAENRGLTPEEKQQAKNAIEVISSQRELVGRIS